MRSYFLYLAANGSIDWSTWGMIELATNTDLINGLYYLSKQEVRNLTGYLKYDYTLRSMDKFVNESMHGEGEREKILLSIIENKETKILEFEKGFLSYLKKFFKGKE